MREILYRGLNANGEFVYGLPYLDAPNSTVYYNDYSYRITWIPENGGHTNQPVKNGTIGQFIGIVDKNGVKIFEGDIVECILTDIFNVSNLYIGKVFYQDYEYCVETTDYYWPVASWDCVEYCIVIGNIHQNPELLEDNT